MKKIGLAIVVLGTLVIAGNLPIGAKAARSAVPAHSVTHQRSVLRYLAQGCFHVAPRQFVCPLPSP